MTFDNIDRPECRNLLGIYGLMSGKDRSTVAAECQDMGWGQFKPLLTEATIAHLQPIQAKYHEIMGERTYLESILRDGAAQAREIANRTLVDVKEALGYSLPL
jgi:tryptophanyl-tRNA synthetase